MPGLRQMSALDRLRQGTYNEKEGQLLWWSLYFKITFDSTQTNPLQYNLYADKLGQNGTTLASRNNRGAGIIPQASKFEAHAIETYYVPNAAKIATELQDITDAFADGYLRFEINGKSNQLELNLTQLMGNPFPTVLTQLDSQPMGRGQYTGTWELPVPIILAAESSYKAEINFDNAPNATMNGDIFLMSMVGTLVQLT